MTSLRVFCSKCKTSFSKNMSDHGVADGFQDQTQEQRDLYGDENNGERGSVFRNTNRGSLR